MGLIKRVLLRHCGARLNQKKMITSNVLMEAIAKANGGHWGTNVVSHRTQEDGVVRMKILVRKQNLKQVLELTNGTTWVNYANNHKVANSNNNQASLVVKPSSSLCQEQRLNLLRKKQILRANLGKHRHHGSWFPALQSIPEEVY